MRALKTIVIFLGGLCVAAFAVLVYVVATGVGKGPAETPPFRAFVGPKAGRVAGRILLGARP
jgi:hypothetical protein